MQFLKEELIEELLRTPAASRVDNNIVVRCPYCGDSVKTRNHGHLSITIPKEDDSVMPWHCYRCDESGIVTPKLLEDLELGVTSELKSGLKTYNRVVGRSARNRNKLRFNQGYRIVIPPVKFPSIARIKKDYIESRMGVSLSYDEWAELKVIFNLAEVVIGNCMEVQCKTAMLRILNLNYIGFLSSKGEYVTCRDVTGESKLRYYKYKMAADVDDTRKMYIIPTTIDTLSCNPIEINIAEGTFDILGVYFRLKNMDRDNKVYVAACGCGFASIISYLVSQGIFGDHITVNIYSDKDKGIEFYRHKVEQLKPFVGKIRIFYNDAAKDYGDVKDPIVLTEAVIQ